jgi:hypothetical protein
VNITVTIGIIRYNHGWSRIIVNFEIKSMQTLIFGKDISIKMWMGLL